MSYENMPSSITRPAADRDHALLFVGVCNRERYALSLRRWTRLLNEMYGFPLANIRIVVGTYSNASWPLMIAGTDVTYDATMSDLDDALSDYATGSGTPYALGADDNLFIFTFNHGGQDTSGCYLCCENFAQNYYATTFAARTNAIHCRQIVLLAAQCHAGGFVDPFIDTLWSATRGAVLAGCRADQNTMEAVFDKLVAAAINGRMVPDSLDDNIDIGINGDGMDVTTVPGYHENRVDWGPTGVISMREVHNWVTDHYVNHIYPSYSSINEIPVYRQKPWTESGEPVDICLGQADLVMTDCVTDTGQEPCGCSPWWYSPDLYPDNSDEFPGLPDHQYVPAHYNRFAARISNRGNAPTDNIWSYMEVRGLGFTGGPVGPPRIDKALETDGGSVASARLRPGRAHTQFQRILIGDDFGHGCISALTWSGTDEMDHTLWQITQDNDQVQCNINAASVSGSFPVDSAATNSNAGRLNIVMPIFAEAAGGDFEIQLEKAKGELPFSLRAKTKLVHLKKMEKGRLVVELRLTKGRQANPIEDGLKGRFDVLLLKDKKIIGGATFIVETATAHAHAMAFDERNLPISGAKIVLSQPGIATTLSAKTNKKGIAQFGPMNPGFYFAKVDGSDAKPIRVWIRPGDKNSIRLLTLRKDPRPKLIPVRSFLAEPHKANTKRSRK